MAVSNLGGGSHPIRGQPGQSRKWRRGADTGLFPGHQETQGGRGPDRARADLAPENPGQQPGLFFNQRRWRHQVFDAFRPPDPWLEYRRVYFKDIRRRRGGRARHAHP